MLILRKGDCKMITISLGHIPQEKMCAIGKLAFQRFTKDKYISINRKIFRKFVKCYDRILKRNFGSYKALYGINHFLNDLGKAPYTSMNEYYNLSHSQKERESKIYNALKNYLLSLNYKVLCIGNRKEEV